MEIPNNVLYLIKNDLLALSFKYHDGGEDKLSFFAPQSPNTDILNSEIPDHLSHCVKIPIIIKLINPMLYNTTIAIFQCYIRYHGVDKIIVTTKRYFIERSELPSEHEDATIVGRKNINYLLHKKVEKNKISQELADTLIRNAKTRY